MSLDQILVTLCVFSAGAYLVRRKWNSFKRTDTPMSCAGDCGCAKRLKADSR
jgi:hypothetical protein